MNFKKVEQDNSRDNFKAASQYLLEAINDWPIEISDLNAFIVELTARIGLPLSLERIKAYSSSLTPKYLAWEMESIASLIQVFNNDPAKKLDIIINGISNHYKHK